MPIFEGSLPGDQGQAAVRGVHAARKVCMRKVIFKCLPGRVGGTEWAGDV